MPKLGLGAQPAPDHVRRPRCRLTPCLSLPGPVVYKGFSTALCTVFAASSLTLSNFAYTEFYTMPIPINTVYADGNCAYKKHMSESTVITGKMNTQRIERKHLSLCTWCSRLVRKGIRFSRLHLMHFKQSYLCGTRLSFCKNVMYPLRTLPQWQKAHCSPLLFNCWYLQF